jgi:hypothetical protein
MMSSAPTATRYNTAFFTPEHEEALGGIMPVREYHALAAKHTTTIEPVMMNVDSATFEEDMGSALRSGRHCMIDGAMHTTEDGVMEIQEKFVMIINTINKVAPHFPGKHYIHILGPHRTAYPHPKLLKWLEGEDRKFTLDGGFWAPGQPMPEQTVVAEVSVDGKKVVLTTGLMCSVYSNFNTVKSEVTPGILGCDPEIVPACAMEVKILSAEHVIQFAKAVAAIAFPEMYMNTEVSDADFMRAMDNLEKIKKSDLKRKFEGKRFEQVVSHCEEVLALLTHAKDFADQKKLGQIVILTKDWFSMVAGTPVEAVRDFTAEDLKHFGANNVMQALAIMLRVHGGDEALYERLDFDIKSKNVPVETAMHDPVKAKNPAPGASKYLFTGLFSDRVWGSFAGCPRYTPMFDGLVHTDGKPQIGHLGNGAELVRQAMKGDKAVLDFLGLAAPLTKESMGAGAAAALNKFWAMARR